MRNPYSRIAAFVDWNSQLLLNGRPSPAVPPLSLAQITFKRVTKRITSCLAKIEPNRQFHVHLRLYHGWHKGYEPSPNCKAVKQVIAETDFATLSSKPNVIFSADVGFGDCLLSALPERIHSKLAIHLPNTLRDRGGQGSEEKMVDTALASDVIVTAYQDPENWILVAAEDDDIVPPLFVAEAIIKRMESRVLLLRSRKTAKNFLKLDDILVGEV